jgi:hypothetical protein
MTRTGGYTIQQFHDQLKYDPIPLMLSGGDEALKYSVRRDLLGEDAGLVERLWQLPGAVKILKKQLPNGSWPRPGENKHPAINHALIETWRQFRFLIERYGMTRAHTQVERAAEFIFSCQTEEGDIRGFLANQYATYYTGAVMALLIQVGYAEDPRIEKGFQWLLGMRQDDGGWSIPMITHKLNRATQYRLSSEYAEPLEPDRTKPFSHHWTGMVLRAFAVHPVYCDTPEARKAGELLKSRFFQPDAYSSYQAASYWVRFEQPLWWTNLLTALDSLARMGFSAQDGQIRKGLDWLREHQEPGGLWRVSYVNPGEKEKETAKARDMKLWVSLAICKVFRRLYG